MQSNPRNADALIKPRAMVKRGDYYGPEPRKLATYRPKADGYPPQEEQAVDRSPNYVIFTT